MSGVFKLAPAYASRSFSATGSHTFSPYAYLHPAVQTWKQGIARVGGTVTDAILGHHDTFMRALDAASLTSKIYRLNTFSGSNREAALVPIIKPAGFAVDLTSGAYVFGQSTGLTGNATDRDIHTGVRARPIDISNVALFFYGSNFEQTTTERCGIGTVDGAAAGTGLNCQLNVCGPANKPYFQAARLDATNPSVTLSVGTASGFLLGSVRTLGTLRIFLNGVFDSQQIATTLAPASTFGREYFVFGRQATDLQLTACNGFQYGISVGLQDSEVATLYGICHALALALGRT